MQIKEKFQIEAVSPNSAPVELPFKHFIFPAGEVSVRVDDSLAESLMGDDDASSIRITARLHNSEDILTLMMLHNALISMGYRNNFINLVMPYVPYARQDRICNPGEPFSIKVFANLINSMKFETVLIIDPHSDVTSALINGVEIVTKKEIFLNWFALEDLTNRAILVSPDAGSNKQVADLAKCFNYDSFIRADKIRDVNTGDITETVVYSGDIRNENVLIVDDICEGGRTFIELAKVLRSKNAGEIHLYVTHGIFSKGIEALYDAGITKIWTTDSYHHNSNLDTFKISDLMLY